MFTVQESMTAIRKTLLAAGLIGTAGFLAGCATTVQPGQLGLRYKSFHRPALQKETRSEGWYWRFPWNRVEVYDVTYQSKNEDVEILTADDLHVRTKVTVTFRPEREKLYDLATQVGKNYYAQVIRPPFTTIARSEFSRHMHNALAKDSPVIETDILTRLRAALSGKDIEIDRVSIDHIEYNQEVTYAISAKIATLQRVETKDLEIKVAEREAEITRAQARGKSDAVRINAEGEAQAMVVKGEAQAKAQAAINKTLTDTYLRYKAFDNPGTRYYFVPVGKDGLPLIINAGRGD